MTTQEAIDLLNKYKNSSGMYFVPLKKTDIDGVIALLVPDSLESRVAKLEETIAKAKWQERKQSCQ